MKQKIIYFVLSIYFNIQIVHMNSCESHKTCNECITDPDVCLWCVGDSTWPRCRSEKDYDKNWCKGSIDEPEKAAATPSKIHNREFSSKFEDIVQIRPQQFDVKLRAGKPVDFEFYFQGAKDYPVDLYFLLDASRTMETEKTKIVEQSENIVLKMKSMTNDVRLAFGTYIDKNAQPFTLYVKSNLSYSFKHHLNFTTEAKIFQGTVNRTTFGGNRDNLEGGFDALAQLMTCVHDLGWRPMSRKVIVFITDSPHHTAGDGRSAGIFQPYDDKCYTKNGVYTKELEMDYPSVGTINRLASENKFIVCFALTDSTQKPLYEMLVKAIDGSRMAVLEGTAFAEELKVIYENISTNLRLELSDTKNTYEIKFEPDCLSSNDDTITNNDCIVKNQEQRKFKGTITLRKYVQETELIDISIQGVKEKITLNVEVINKCTCEKSTDHDSRACNEHGIRKCGICKCYENWVGPNCKCNTKTDTRIKSDLCKAPGQEDYCSGSANGVCDCEECKCFEHRFGPFCECDYRMCMSNGTKLCNGHGTCSCNSNSVNQKESCKCREGWSGDYCECLNAKDSCKSSMDDRICNGRGDCICDKCKCHKPALWDKRIKMDELCRVQNYSEFHSYQCKVVSACALCHLDSKNCTETKCDGIKVDKIYDKLPAEDLNNPAWTMCIYKAESGCYTKFIYKFDDEVYRIMLRMQKHQECAKDYYIIGLIVFGTVVLVGILTILGWKLCTYYQDRKEFLKFEKEHQDELSRPSVNPLYDAPTTHFRNPAFKRSFTKD